MSLFFFISVPFFFSFCFLFIHNFWKEHITKLLGFSVSLFIFFYSLQFWLFFDNSVIAFQFVSSIFWIDSSIFFCLGIDGISLFFIVLTTFLVPLCILGSWQISMNKFIYNYNLYFSFFLLIEGFILVVFTSLDLLLFYTFFEAVLIPMFIVIGIWGSRERKIRAAYMFFLYTLFGSLFMLLGLVLIFFETGTIDFNYLIEYNVFSVNRQLFLWFGFFIAFAVKMPMVPVHIWLPEAHVEAPTAGSVLLAGILLKLGSYGFIRFCLLLFPGATLFFRPLVFVLAVVAIIYTSLTALRQSDIKRVIAYASVAHINATLLGIFSFNLSGFEGAVFQIIGHGIVSGGLFFCIGVLYDRHHSRMINYYSGVVQTMPLFSFIFLVLIMSNIALPGTISFVGEFLIFSGVIGVSFLAAFFGSTGMFLGGGYSLWLYNRIVYGNIKTQFISVSYDLLRREFFVFFPLVFCSIFIGFFPNFFFETIHMSSLVIVERITFI